MHIQYSYNSKVSILLVSLLSRASGSLRTTPFHFLRNVFTLVYNILGEQKGVSFFHVVSVTT